MHTTPTGNFTYRLVVVFMIKTIFNLERYLPGNEVALVSGGEPYFSRLFELIDSAKKLLHFQVYIFDEDETGKAVAEALKKACQRGVEVFLAVDSYGSKDLSPAFIADLKESGVHFKFFSPLPRHFYAFRLGRRLHSKVVVADQSLALVGGINISNKYRGTAEEAPWLDFALHIKGPVCVGLTRTCERIYREKYFGRVRLRRKKKVLHPPNAVRSRFALNDWFRRKNQIGAAYRAAFQKARHSIVIVASYFMPSRTIRTALKKASRRGVQITVLLPGKSDIPMAKRATRYLYQELFQNKVSIYEWENSILHGKMAIVDKKWVTVGSYNLNHLSQFSSIEVNVEVLDKGFAATAHEYLETLLQQSTLISADVFGQTQNRWNKFLDWASYTIGRWTMLFLFYLVQREHRLKEKE